MENWLSEPPYLFSGICALSTAIGFAAILAVKKISKIPKPKVQSNKALLKELLEGFGLDVPAELTEDESIVVKSIKSP